MAERFEAHAVRSTTATNHHGHLRNHGWICGKPAMTAARCSWALRPRISALDTSTIPENVSGPLVQLQDEGRGGQGQLGMDGCTH